MKIAKSSLSGSPDRGTTTATVPTRRAPAVQPASALHLWVPRLTIGLAVVHSVVGAIDPTWLKIFRDGIWNTSPIFGADQAAIYPRHANLWSLMGGLGMAAVGIMAREGIKTTGKLPASTGPILITMSILPSIMTPAGGAWLVMATGVLAVIANRRARSTTSS